MTSIKCGQCRYRFKRETKLREHKGQEICSFCYETYLGNILKYPNVYQNVSITLVQGLCQSFNKIDEKMDMILDKLSK